MRSAMVREDSELSSEDAHFALLQNKNAIASNVLWKRKEQLMNWEASETNRLPSVRKALRETKVKFTEADIFLSACLSGDFQEVELLLENGADINTCTVDGLTALHQAIIDGKPEMAEFLIDHGANINAQDNEGWTPLHAAACCGYTDLVVMLCTKGSDISITNSDKELAVDLAEEDDCRMALEEAHERQQIDPNECRNRELAVMRYDAEQWLKDGEIRDRPHDRSGASALHVAAAKGYMDVIKMLLHAGADVNCRDRDGWTPLHAAAHWGEHEAASLLIQHGASFTEVTNNGETVVNVADKSIVEFLEGMQEKERIRIASNNSVNVLLQANAPLKRAGSTTAVLRMSTEEKSKKTKLDEQDENKELREGCYSLVVEEKTPSPTVEARLPFPTKREVSESVSEEERLSEHSSERSSEEKRPSSSNNEATSSSSETERATVSDSTASVEQTTAEVDANCTNDSNSLKELTPASINSSVTPKSSTVSRSASTESTSSLSANQKFTWRQSESPSGNEGSKKETNSTAVQDSGPFNKQPVNSSTSLPWTSLYRNSTAAKPLHPAFAHFQAAVRQASESNFDHSSACLSSSSRGSLPTPPTVPNLPNESEAERRSKAKRQRDSRRSTQGVTREQLRAATLTVRRDDKENDSNWNILAGKSSSSSPSEFTHTEDSDKGSGDMADSKTISTFQTVSAVRRRSQVPRNLRRGTGPLPSEELHISEERKSDINKLSNTQLTSSIAPVNAESASSCSSNSAKDVSPVSYSTNGKIKQTTTQSSGFVQTHPVHIGATAAPLTVYSVPQRSANNSVDYKLLYETEKLECERLRKKLETLSVERSSSLSNNLSTTRNYSPRIAISKTSSSSSIDDRERRSYEQRISELQYEVEQLEHLRADNQKLKEENGALIRVISKLSK